MITDRRAPNRALSAWARAGSKVRLYKENGATRNAFLVHAEGSPEVSSSVYAFGEVFAGSSLCFNYTYVSYIPNRSDANEAGRLIFTSKRDFGLAQRRDAMIDLSGATCQL